MTGFLIPSTYKAAEPTDINMNIASIFFGFSIGVGLFTGSMAIGQSWASWKRSGRFKPYPAMIWAEWLSSMIICVIAWGFLRGYIEPSFWFFFTLILFWCIQIQCLMQIIINRIALLMVVRAKATRLKWSVFLCLLVINISVFCVWIPARLQISDTIVRINEIWDRMEKGLFCIIDAGLNIYFIYLVRSRLIDNGLTKYNRLFNFNVAMVFVSISLDVILIGIMSLPNSFTYLAFHPVSYLVKLHIEMNMAELITKVVRATNPHMVEGGNQNSSGPGDGTNPLSRRGYGAGTGAGTGTGAQRQIKFDGGWGGPHGMSTRVGHGDGDELELGNRNVTPEAVADGNGIHVQRTIHKTIHTEVVSKPVDEDDASESSSTRHLKRNYLVD